MYRIVPQGNTSYANFQQVHYSKFVNDQELKIFNQGFLQHCAVVHKDCMYVFGGINEAKKVVNNLWKFDFTTESWSLVQQTNPIEPRIWSTCHIYQGKLLVIGGDNGNKHYDELCLFDFDTCTWQTQPCEVVNHCKSVLKGDHLYLVGGSRPEQVLGKEEANNLAQVIENISDDVILNILKYLLEIDINRMILVSKNWKVSKIAKRM